MRTQQPTHKPIPSIKQPFTHREINHCVSEQVFNATRLVLSEGIQKMVAVLYRAELLSKYKNSMSYLNS